MAPHLSSLMAKAWRTLRSARLILGSGDPESAMSRNYYAAYYAARASLLSEGITPRTHAGTHEQFRDHFVLTGKVDEAVARVLPRAYRLRQAADYEVASEQSEESVSWYADEVELFIRAVEHVLD